MIDPIQVVLDHEGGFVNHKRDRGGPTNFGVTQKTYSHYLGRKATLDDVRNMTEETAREIYERNYYTGPRIHTLPDPPQTLVLDMAINHGPRNAIKMLQRVVNSAGFGPMTVDGVIGPMTRKGVEKAAKAMGKHFQNALVEERIRFYNRIVASDPSQKVFIKGWLNRAETFRLA